jgi:hypothetical protein
MITHAMPVALQRGKSAEIVVQGQMNFAGVYKVLVEGTGVRGAIISETPAAADPKGKRRPGPRLSSVKLSVAVDDNAALGVREFRLASALGISSIGQLVIVDGPVVQEKGDNNTPEKANPIPVPCVVCGRIEAPVDVDYYKFHARAGRALTFEVLCARLEDKIHDLQKHADPLLSLYDEQGRELAANDDFYFADPLLEYRVPQDGDYYIQVRDSKYDGDSRWVYALLITDRPYVSHIYPMAGNPGQTLSVELVGTAAATCSHAELHVPSEPGLHRVHLNIDGVPTNPVTVLTSALPQVQEQEPNDTPARANRVSIPCGINGRIGQRRDLDHFIFHAPKGKAVRFEVKARRFGSNLVSSLDSVLDVLTTQGKSLASNDDTFGKDAALVFTPPAEGDYVLRIRDLNSKGGPTAVYYIEADWARPDFTLRCDPDKAMIGPGSSTAWYVQVQRANGFTGPVKVAVTGVPRGVTVSPLTISPTMTQGLLVLTASADAPRDAVNVQVTGTAEVRQPDGAKTALRRTATPDEEIYLPGGGRGRFDVHMQTITVTDPSDILEVDVTPSRLTLRPGQEARLDVALKRRPDYQQGVTLDVVLQHLGRVYGSPLPPGVTVVPAKSKTLLGNGSKGYITLKAAANAPPIEDVPISVLAHVSINFVVKISYSSPALCLTIRK